ncbi:hypothetical protein T440DRAFT_17542 [Plenodomus tracheiphilus IPT5]|uniref:Uncharacterized protein n=1 Tax=Plenodomus tracheiphilus IPT5 TaxID=1408161 RepID=A0A6A7BB68_9PLEO|nr:hypothetical protein T440DRAFT_17542 [Plenodomus tracheiphilus IPT5]
MQHRAPPRPPAASTATPDSHLHSGPASCTHGHPRQSAPCPERVPCSSREGLTIPASPSSVQSLPRHAVRVGPSTRYPQHLCLAPHQLAFPVDTTCPIVFSSSCPPTECGDAIVRYQTPIAHLKPLTSGSISKRANHRHRSHGPGRLSPD